MILPFGVHGDAILISNCADHEHTSLKPTGRKDDV